MSTNATAKVEGIDLAPRTRRALERKLSVTPDIGRARDADDLALVMFGNSEKTYLVDVRAGTCECPDATHRDLAGGCYHVRRARMAMGRDPIPAVALGAVDVDPQLGEHTAATPRVAAADGGEVLQAERADHDADAADADRERPAACECTPSIDAESGEELGTLPCFECANQGFSTVNPAFPGLEGDDE